MYQFFVEPSQIQGTRVVITGSDVNHIKNVLRMKVGEELAVSNGSDGKEYRCGIEAFLDGEVLCTLRFIKEDAVELPSKISLFQGLPKGDKMELIIQKAVELGVYEIIPVVAGRSVVRLDEKRAQNKLARWQEIARAAAKQSKRALIPKVQQIMKMEEAVVYAEAMDVKLIPYELAEDMAQTRELISRIKPGESIAVFIGPEGGFEEKEVKAAIERGITPITMGRRILRTETAGPAVLAWLMYHLEEA
ncbi:MAG: 16S rRNA (uracil(1498)-N(3))-methyltransferase [Blautia sp.]|nr:16S rRNA (uracil(1498)-N(3))-methyltransferase [Lachnoclostridium sp.]MCM1211158.1 16S rRNA (uracil(1498)-N(3))-methyltransferase [Blautia sp.]